MTRSRNNNMFIYSSYWHQWSRILFHDHGGRGIEATRRQYDIPKHIKTIEVDLVGRLTKDWDKLAQVNIRCHCTSISSSDILRGSLPDEVVKVMQEALPPRTVDIMLHVNLLPYIDFDKYRAHPSGAVSIEACIKDFPTLDQYWSMQRQHGGPGVLRHDVEESWESARAYWLKKVQVVLPQQIQN